MSIDQQPRAKMGIERKDYTGFIQSFREKKNISYKLKDGREIFAKFAKYQGTQMRNNLTGMNNEAKILNRLESTGITPKVIQLKNYPNEKMVRLVTEKVPGTSLDNLEIKEEDKGQIFQNVITSSAQALQKIHNEGIYVVDINTGTFLVNSDGLDCRVVDFELAIDSNHTNEEEIKIANKFRHERLTPVLGFEIQNTTEGTRKKELYTWANTMLDFLAEKTGSLRISEQDFAEDELPEEKRVEYQNYIKTIKEKINNYVADGIEKEISDPKREEQLKKWFEMRLDQSQTYDEFIEDLKTKEIEKKTKRFLNAASLKLTLKYKLEKLGINLPEKTVTFLEKCLDINPDNRPESFDELINS